MSAGTQLYALRRLFGYHKWESASAVLLGLGKLNAYHIAISSRDYHLHSFYPQTVRDWNVPEAVVMATSSVTFKDSISQ